MAKSNPPVFEYKSAFTYGFDGAGVAKKGEFSSSTQYKSAFGYTYQMIPPASDGEKVENLWAPKISRAVIIIFFYVLVIALFPFSLWICLKKVNALERLVVLRLGKLQPVSGPGYCIVLPLIDSCSVVDLRPKTITIPSQKVLTSDGAIMEISATIKYSVCHTIDYVIKLHKQEQSVQSLVEHYFTNFISEKEQASVEKNQDLISSSIKVELNRTVVNWGLEIIDVSLGSVRVLKEAEPLSSLNHVIGVLKNVGNSCNLASLVMPNLPVAKNVTETKGNIFLSDVSKEVETNTNHGILLQVSNFLEDAKKQNTFDDIVATYKFILLGERKKILSISINNGNATVSEKEVDDLMTADVTITLTMDDMQDFLSLKTSPLEAYLEGKLKVEGNLNLLKNLADGFKKSDIIL